MGVGIAKEESVEVDEDVDIGEETHDDEGEDAFLNHILKAACLSPCHSCYGEENRRESTRQFRASP